jgi:phosphoribosylamine--glycine ligase
MKYLVIGSGGREHAFAWKLKLDEPAAEIFIAPGNAGTEEVGTNVPIGVTDLDALVTWARKEKPDLTVVGPEGPLVAGIVDRFESAGLPIFGPNQAAARLEGSKVYTKNFLLKYGLPTAPGAGFSASAEAIAYSRAHPQFPQVLKADGLAAGKGVIIAKDAAEAEETIRRIMDERVFGEAGSEMLIEEFSFGREMSIHIVTDGIAYRMLPIAQDHKKLLDDDQGPNTGGMGAYAPAPFATPELRAQVAAEVVEPVLAAFKKEGIDFRGILYIGLIWTPAGPSILEFNVRGGDPETQVLLPLLKTPLAQILQAVRQQRLTELTIEFLNLYAVSVVLAAAGYPDKPTTGDQIFGLNDVAESAMAFHGSTCREGNKCLTNGGRVLSLTGWSENLTLARAVAYKETEKINFTGRHKRCDIAARTNLVNENYPNLPSFGNQSSRHEGERGAAKLSGS